MLTAWAAVSWSSALRSQSRAAARNKPKPRTSGSVNGSTKLKEGAHGQPRSGYSFRHSSITFGLLDGQGIDLLTLWRNARTAVEVINTYYASTVTGQQNVAF